MLSYKCPQCGAPIEYQPGTDEVKCEYCNGVSTVEELEAYAAKLEAEAKAKAAKLEAESQQAAGNASLPGMGVPIAPQSGAPTTGQAGWTAAPGTAPGSVPGSIPAAEDIQVFRCQSCGAEIISEPGTAAAICQYCHSPVILTDRLANEFRPHQIIPFKYDKKFIKDYFKKQIAKKFFIPRSFNTETQLDSMEGVYLPFWNYAYSAHVDTSGSGKVINSWEEGDDIITETKTYDFVETANLTFNHISCYASKKLPEESVAMVTPFVEDKVKPFAMPYLTGYRAENYQTDAKTTEKQAEIQVNTAIDEEIRDLTHDLSQVTFNKKESSYDMTKDPDLILKPVYVMTYQYMRKKYVFTINGQTKKIHGEMPLDVLKLNLVSLLVFLLCLALWLGVFFFIGSPANVIEEQTVRSYWSQVVGDEVQAMEIVQTPSQSEAPQAIPSQISHSQTFSSQSFPSHSTSGPLLARPYQVQANRGTSRAKEDWEQLPDVASTSGPPTGSWDGTDPEEMDRIEDLGELFSEEEKEALNKRLNEVSKKYYTDFILLTTKKNKYRDPVKYTEHYYVEHFDKDQDNIIILFDMDLREYRQTFKGISLWYFEDNRQQAIVHEVLPFLKDANYVGAVNTALDQMSECFDRGASTTELLSIEKGKGTVDEYTKKQYHKIQEGEFGLSMILAGIMAWVFRHKVKRAYRPKRRKWAYATSESPEVDHLVHRRTLVSTDRTRRRKPPEKDYSSGSGGGSSSGGVSTYSSGGSTSSSSGGKF